MTKIWLKHLIWIALLAISAIIFLILYDFKFFNYPSNKEFNWVKSGYQIKDNTLFWGICGKEGCVPKKIEGIDIQSFSVFGLNQNYGKDFNHIFFQDDIIENAHLDSFEIVQDSWTKNFDAQDKFHKYNFGKIAE